MPAFLILEDNRQLCRNGIFYSVQFSRSELSVLQALAMYKDGFKFQAIVGVSMVTRTQQDYSGQVDFSIIKLRASS